MSQVEIEWIQTNKNNSFQIKSLHETIKYSYKDAFLSFKNNEIFT